MTLQPASASPRILVVDDEAGIRLFVRRVLERAGHSVEEAGDGLQGMQMFAQAGNRFDLIICDLQMPQVNGDALTARLLAEDQDVKVICMSGHLLERQTAAGQRVAYLQKPFSAEALRHTVGILLSTS